MMRNQEAVPGGQFNELVKLHLHGVRFLDRETEHRLLEEGVTRYNLTLAEASAIVRNAAVSAGITNEPELCHSASELLRIMADKKRRVARPDFEKVAAFYRTRSGDALSPADARKRVKRLMEESDLTPRPSGRILRTRRWYRVIGS